MIAARTGRTRWRVSLTLASALALSVAVFAISGCRKRHLPSEQYAQAHELFTKLYAAELDDAFADPQMTGVEELLEQVPDNSSDFADASELLRRIREGRTKLQEAEAARRAAAAKVLAGGSYQRMDARASQPDPASAAEDAGSSQPSPHLPLAEFTRRFSGCFRPSDQINVIGQGMFDSWELKDIANCRDRHPGFDQLLVLTDSKEVAMNVAKSMLEYRLPDGGLPSQAGSPASTSAR